MFSDILKDFFLGFWQAILGVFGKSDQQKLGQAQVKNEDLAASNKILEEQLKVANQGTTIADVQKDLQGGRF